MKYRVDLYLNVATTVHDVIAEDESAALAHAVALVQRYENKYTERRFELEGHRVTTSQSDDSLISDTAVDLEDE